MEALPAEMTVATELLCRTLEALTPEVLARPIFYPYPVPATRTLLWVGAQAVHEMEHHLDDVRTLMSDAGPALLGIGMGTGEERAIDAARHAVESPLLETSMEGARKILLSITSCEDLSLWEVNEAAKAVAEAAHPDANIIFGAMVDERLDNQVWVTVVATGFGGPAARPPRRRIEEPAGEPRVERRGPAPAPREPARRSALGVSELDVPEFIPRG